ncbi:hypothetical protein ACTA71_001454 [Dictyostelium dimigraforme]
MCSISSYMISASKKLKEKEQYEEDEQYEIQQDLGSPEEFNDNQDGDDGYDSTNKKSGIKQIDQLIILSSDVTKTPFFLLTIGLEPKFAKIDVVNPLTTKNAVSTGTANISGSTVNTNDDENNGPTEEELKGIISAFVPHFSKIHLILSSLQKIPTYSEDGSMVFVENLHNLVLFSRINVCKTVKPTRLSYKIRLESKFNIFWSSIITNPQPRCSYRQRGNNSDNNGIKNSIKTSITVASKKGIKNSINNSIKTESTTITAASKTIAVETSVTKQKRFWNQFYFGVQVPMYDYGYNGDKFKSAQVVSCLETTKLKFSLKEKLELKGLLAQFQHEINDQYLLPSKKLFLGGRTLQGPSIYQPDGFVAGINGVVTGTNYRLPSTFYINLNRPPSYLQSGNTGNTGNASSNTGNIGTSSSSS